MRYRTYWCQQGRTPTPGSHWSERGHDPPPPGNPYWKPPSGVERGPKVPHPDAVTWHRDQDLGHAPMRGHTVPCFLRETLPDLENTQAEQFQKTVNTYLFENFPAELWYLHNSHFQSFGIPIQDVCDFILQLVLCFYRYRIR